MELLYQGPTVFVSLWVDLHTEYRWGAPSGPQDSWRSKHNAHIFLEISDSQYKLFQNLKMAKNHKFGTFNGARKFNFRLHHSLGILLGSPREPRLISGVSTHLNSETLQEFN